jgi:uncharacterized protein (TIGR02300 family)
MTNAPITILKRPDIDHAMNDMPPKCHTPEVAVIEGTTREQQLELASSRPSGVLKELALARWRGAATQVYRPPQRDVAETPMTTTNASQSNKAARGTKRVCQACEVRFYDLLREPIVCPSCGAHYTPVVQPVVEVWRRAAPVAGKTGWRQSVKRPRPVLPEPDPESTVRPGASAAEDAATEVVTEAPENDIVLEQEPDDADVSGLVDLDVEKQKER